MGAGEIEIGEPIADAGDDENVFALWEEGGVAHSEFGVTQ